MTKRAVMTGLIAVLTLAAAPPSRASDPAFSDPEKLPPSPPGALGYPSRAPDLDAWPGFVNPPLGYGEVGFYWWLGDTLTKERLTWQLDRLSGLGISGLQINYAHSDWGGQSYGLTYPSDPPLFSDDWWKLVEWFAGEAKKRGMAISLSDYTLPSPGQGFWVDDIREQYPDLRGSLLDCVPKDAEGGEELVWEVPDGTVGVTAFSIQADTVEPGTGLDLRGRLEGRTLRWQVPPGHWRIAAVRSQIVPSSTDPMDPRFGEEVIKRFYQRFEDHLPGEAGKALNFFFSDELSFGIRGNLWNRRFAEEFRRRKGYDVVPELPALFMDIGPRTPKVRLDYNDVLVSLEEEAYFKPLFDWHYRRGMLYGSDHGGRGRDVTEFGDYFRTQRWMLGPGNDQPDLGRDVIKTKVSSSMSHLYMRPRTWLEGYYGSGWGTTPDQLTYASAGNYVMGSNLQCLHGLYYTTHGGWWEWAPPCNHFRMPYWAHMGVWMKWSQRMCYLLSQGVHRCDVAIVYPVTPMEAGMDGQQAVDNAFRLGEHLFAHGIDFDFIDDDSVARAQPADGELCVSGERYRVLVLPAMKAVRYATLERAAAFKRAGGTVIALVALPEASDRAGRNDPGLNALVKETFPVPAGSVEDVEKTITSAFPRDFAGPGKVLHRRIGPRDVFLVCDAPEGAECSFRATGRVELWDPWTGTKRVLAILNQTEERTVLKMPLSQREAQLIVFSPGQPVLAESKPTLTRVMKVEGDWEFELKPMLDNRWGDFRWPPTPTVIGAEARQFRCAAETLPDPGWQAPGFDDSKWPKVTSSYGPMFWKLGPRPESADDRAFEEKLALLEKVDPSAGLPWRPYEFSWRWGLEQDPGHQGYHGLKEEVPDDFIALGHMKPNWTDSTYEKEEGGTRYYLWTTVFSPCDQQARILQGGTKPSAVWLNHSRVDLGTQEVRVKAGSNPLLLRYDEVGRGFVVLDTGNTQVPSREHVLVNGQPVFKTSPLAMTWYGKSGILPFDTRPEVVRPVDWYRFVSPPGLRAMTVTACGQVWAWADGKELKVDRLDNPSRLRVTIVDPSPDCVKVALRVQEDRACYGGAAIPEPIVLDCGPGRLSPGDWSQIDGLASYSGGAWYRKTVRLTAGQAAGTVTLDLGQVAASAEVHVNGQPAGVRVACPWAFDVSRLVKAGENRVEVLVYNALANHYSTIPTRYRGSSESGLLGPVTIRTDGSGE